KIENSKLKAFRVSNSQSPIRWRRSQAYKRYWMLWPHRSSRAQPSSSKILNLRPEATDPRNSQPKSALYLREESLKAGDRISYRFRRFAASLGNETALRLQGSPLARDERSPLLGSAAQPDNSVAALEPDPPKYSRKPEESESPALAGENKAARFECAVARRTRRMRNQSPRPIPLARSLAPGPYGFYNENCGGCTVPLSYRPRL